MHVSISPQAPHPSRLPHNTEQFPMLYSRTLLLIHFKYSSVYMPIPNYPFPASFPSPTTTIISFSNLWVYFYFVDKFILSFLYRFHIEGVSYNISPSLSDLLYSVWQPWQPTPVFLPEESHGQRSLVGYSPWDHKESNMTEVNELAGPSMLLQMALLHSF